LCGITESESGRGDPRLRAECIERVRDGDAVVTLVGVVHDHPASVYRVRQVVASAAPAVLALELPPLAVPLTRRQAADERTPPTLGGEMSAAVQAATTSRVVGIDGPSVGFLRSLAGELYRERASPATLRRTAAAVRSVTAAALRSRVGATIGALTTLQVDLDPPTAHAAERGDDPHRQADDERRQVRTAQSVLQTFGQPPATAMQRRARERHMVDRLAALRADGDVVAVVGMAHLDAVAGHLREAT